MCGSSGVWRGAEKDIIVGGILQAATELHIKEAAEALDRAWLKDVHLEAGLWKPHWLSFASKCIRLGYFSCNSTEPEKGAGPRRLERLYESWRSARRKPHLGVKRYFSHLAYIKAGSGMGCFLSITYIIFFITLFTSCSELLSLKSFLTRFAAFLKTNRSSQSGLN